MIAAMIFPPQYAESPRTRMLHAWALRLRPDASAYHRELFIRYCRWDEYLLDVGTSASRITG
jgi:hypothetical protein